MMGPIDLLTAPVMGPIQMVQWLGRKLIEAAENDFFDEGKLQAELAELQAQYDMGEISEEQYAMHEDGLLERINAIRKAKG